MTATPLPCRHNHHASYCIAYPCPCKLEDRIAKLEAAMELAAIEELFDETVDECVMKSTARRARMERNSR